MHSRTEPIPTSELLPFPSALLLDMDGTLTRPHLDFPTIKREMGIEGRPILEAMAEMSGSQLEQAKRVLERHETQAAEASELAEGAIDLLKWARARDLPVAVITRNSRTSIDIVFRRHGLPRCEQLSREDAPHKPDPAALLLACRRLGADPARAWMVGDGQFDVEAAAAAGMMSVWLSLGRTKRPFEAAPGVVVEGLRDVIDLLQRARGSEV